MAAAGFRGAVSPALALAVPAVLGSGEPFPDRDLIVFVTAAVIAVTLLVQAPLLPVVVRWARLGGDEDAVERERRRAEITALQEALGASPAEGAVRREKQHADLRAALLARKHETIVRLWERDEIDDSVLQQVQAVLDLERVSLERHRDIT